MYRKISYPIQSLLYKPLFDCHFRAIKKYKPRIILEAGSGLGRTSMPYVMQGCRVVLLDISSKAIRESRELYSFFNLNSNVEFVMADVFNLPFRDDVFNICHNEGVMEHFSPLESIRIVKEMGRVSSIVIVAVPYRNDFFYNLYKVYCMLIKGKWQIGSVDETIFSGRMERAYTCRQLVEEIRNAELEPVHMELIGDGGRMGVIFDWILQKLFNIFRKVYPPSSVLGIKSPIKYVEALYKSCVVKFARLLGKITFSKGDIVCIAKSKRP